MNLKTFPDAGVLNKPYFCILPVCALDLDRFVFKQNTISHLGNIIFNKVKELFQKSED